MLVRLFGRNFRSLKEDFELSLVAADLTREEDSARGVVDVPISGMDKPLKLLRCVAIYGSNGSGKSTVILAGQALRRLGTVSSQKAKPEGTISSYQPFLLSAKSKVAPVLLGCDVVHGKSLLRYEIQFDAKAILRETLTLMNEGRQKRLVERNGDDEISGSLIGRKGANRLYVKGMQPNVSVLSKLAQHGPRKGKESILPYYLSIRNATRFIDYGRIGAMANGLHLGSDLERFGEDARYREWIMKHLIRGADVGILDVQTRTETISVPGAKRLQNGSKKRGKTGKLSGDRLVVTFRHEGESAGEIDYSHESAGTKKLFRLSNAWWKLANERMTLLVDELGASLHPRILDQMIRSVNDPVRQVHSQLIFTAHDTGLMEGRDGLPPALRRDQVYFTKKSRLGATELYSLMEFKDEARPVHNIRKRYTSGLYGAIPSVEELHL